MNGFHIIIFNRPSMCHTHVNVFQDRSYYKNLRLSSGHPTFPNCLTIQNELTELLWTISIQSITGLQHLIQMFNGDGEDGNCKGESLSASWLVMQN